MFRVGLVSVLGALVINGCDRPTESALSPEFDREGPGANGVGYVITMSNAVSGNAALVFPRASDGTLGAPVAYPTAGLGTGGGLGNQAAIVTSGSGRHLYLVNAGSHTISVFE